MSLLVGNKKRFIATILVLCIAFVLTMIWSVYAYVAMSGVQYKKNQSYVIAQQYEMLYENDRRAILSIEPLLDKTLERTLRDVSVDIKAEDDIDVDYLKHLANVYGITGIWLIEEDKVVHLSSEGVKSTDASQWYKDRPEVEWKTKIDWLLDNEGVTWVDTFSKRNTPPHTYLKWAYMGMGEVPQLGGKVILEIGMSVEDAFTTGQLKGMVSKGSIVSSNIISADIKIPDPQKPEAPVKEYQRIDGDIITTAVKVKDFNGQDTQIVIKTHFPEKQNETEGALILCVGSSLFTMLCLGLLLVVLLRRPRM
jgi:hypothetical protein